MGIYILLECTPNKGCHTQLSGMHPSAGGNLDRTGVSECLYFLFRAKLDQVVTIPSIFQERKITI